MDFDIDVSLPHVHTSHVSQCAECNESFVMIPVDQWMGICRKVALYNAHQLELAFKGEGK